MARMRWGAAMVVALISVMAALTATEAGARPTSQLKISPHGHGTLKWTACPVAFPVPLKVDCGVLTVPMDRRQPEDARRGPVEGNVTLPFAIVRTSSPHPRPDPIVYLAGGPSYNEIDAFSAGFFPGLAFAGNRDFILYNPRGVGFSTPWLGCPEFDQVRAVTYFNIVPGTMWLDAVRRCHDRLIRQGVDLGDYNSAVDAADLNDLRISLGYDTWNIYANSAAGGLAQTVLRLFPEGIRSAIFDSPLSNRFKLRGPDVVRGMNHTLQKMFAGCAADAACLAAYPNLRARFFDRVHELNSHPVVVNLPTQGGGNYPLRYGGDMLLQDAASCSGDAFCVSSLPGLVDGVARGQVKRWVFAMLGPPISHDPPAEPFISEGRTAAFRCHDLYAFEPDSELQVAAKMWPEFRGVLQAFALPNDPGSRRACAIWDVGRAAPAQHQPVVSSVPSLVLTGEWDGLISPFTAHEVSDPLKHAFFYQFPGIGHVTLFWHACPATIAAEFIDAPHMRPNASCISSMPEVSFDPTATGARASSGAVRGLLDVLAPTRLLVRRR